MGIEESAELIPSPLDPTQKTISQAWQGRGLKMTDTTKLDALISRLNSTPVMDSVKSEKLYNAYTRRAVSGMLITGNSYGVASGGLSILNQNEGEFRAELRDKSNNLNAQVSIFDEALDLWFNNGESHPPYYPWRIAVILSKNKLKKKEEEFLRAYSRHFKNRRGGARDAKIKERAAKFGI